MNNKKEIRGDVAAFDKNWEVRKESTYTHFTTDLPKNQIQFAFRNHWEVISSFLESASFNGGKRVLEVGCGRGSLSAYFANNGYDCTLLDKSEKVIDIAKQSFYKLGLESEFIVGDVNNLPFEEETFDLITSIGLLEHFEDIRKPIEEQVRVLSKGGVFTAYVVPEYKNNIQKDYNWINNILRYYSKSFQKQEIAKESLYRSDDDSKKYIRIMKDLGLKNIFSSGIYSVPMISHSIDFPFSLMPDRAEEEIVLYFNNLLEKRKIKYPNQHPWLCKEGHGQAFIVCGYKPQSIPAIVKAPSTRKKNKSISVLGIIPARGGSKGIRKKNIYKLCGEPLINYTIEAAKSSRFLTRTIVSTDSEEIAEIARAAGAEVPFLRPAKLASDKSPTIDTIIHSLNWLKENKNEQYDYVMVLQPTSPLRTSIDIDESIKKAQETGADSIMSMVELSAMSLKKLKKIQEDQIFPLLEEEGKSPAPRTSHTATYTRNAAIYLTKASVILKGDVFGNVSRPYIMPFERSVDINDMKDMALSEFFLKKMKDGNN